MHRKDKQIVFKNCDVFMIEIVSIILSRMVYLCHVPMMSLVNLSVLEDA